MSNYKNIKRFRNCSVLIDNQLVETDVWISNGKFINPQKTFYSEKLSPCETIDCHGGIISPGFIDIQVNGGFGIDFSTPSVNFNENIHFVAKQLPMYGITAFIPTIISSPLPVYQRVMNEFKKYEYKKFTAQVLGLHMEGPFINKHNSGMHPIECLKQDLNQVSIQQHDIDKTYGGDLDGIRMVTLAPELPGALEAIEYLHSRGICVSIGHSSADYNEGVAGIKAGAKMITHLFSCMRPFHHRDPHLIGLLAAKFDFPSSCYFGVISDLYHTHAAALTIAQKTAGKRIILVTDCNLALGLDDGFYEFGNASIQVKNGQSYVAGTNTIAGGTTPLNKCLQRFIKSTRCSIAEALVTVTHHPADMLQLTNKGYIKENYDADFVILNPQQLTIEATFIAGELVYQVKSNSFQ